MFPNNDSELHMITSQPIKAGEEVLISYLDCDVQVRVPSRSISPPWGPIRFRPAPHTYDAPPCGPSVRVVSQTKSRKIPTRNGSPLLFVLQARSQRVRREHLR